MSVTYTPPLRDILRAAAAVGAPLDGLVDDAVAGFAALAAHTIAASDRSGDVFGARLDDEGRVVVAPEVERAFRAFTDGGWPAATVPEEDGGAGLGPVTNAALQELFASANLALSLLPTLTRSGVSLLSSWATDAQKQRYLPPLVDGAWSATMCLTESMAGSDVGMLQTTAHPEPDGTWRLDGQKIFITWGEHDLTENILHLVLARTPGAPTGTRGISVFGVPKLLPDGTRNGIRCVRLEEKLGIHSSPTCVMELDRAFGELIGSECGGMPIMFTMMNAARLAIGLQGLAVAQRSTEQATAYAAERVQGGRLIAAHPDVRRMLLDLRSSTRALRLLLYATAAAEGARADVLTPVAKAWATDEGFRLASLAVQVHGGVGYIEEIGIAQRLRDVRITSIYEGTNGIQAIDLVVRKVRRDGGIAMGAHLDDLERRSIPSEVREPIARALAAARSATRFVLEHDEVDGLAGAAAYLELIGIVTGGVLLAVLAGVDADDDAALDARFFASEHLAMAPGLSDRVAAGAGRLGLDRA